VHPRSLILKNRKKATIDIEDHSGAAWRREYNYQETEMAVIITQNILA
jgi:hypothetical protein